MLKGETNKIMGEERAQSVSSSYREMLNDILNLVSDLILLVLCTFTNTLAALRPLDSSTQSTACGQCD